MTSCDCICHSDGMNSCTMCMDKHTGKETAGYLIDQRLNGFFIDRDSDGKVKNLIFSFDSAELIISWDKEKDSFKFSIKAG